ncbi:MAG: hypothetical protein QM770_20240 [Tepidisphaeraceae bacterium]
MFVSPDVADRLRKQSSEQKVGGMALPYAIENRGNAMARNICIVARYSAALGVATDATRIEDVATLQCLSFERRIGDLHPGASRIISTDYIVPSESLLDGLKGNVRTRTSDNVPLSVDYKVEFVAVVSVTAFAEDLTAVVIQATLEFTIGAKTPSDPPAS